MIHRETYEHIVEQVEAHDILSLVHDTGEDGSWDSTEIAGTIVQRVLDLLGIEVE